MVLGKHALVTGATGGLGKSIAKRLASEGCKLSLLGRSGLPEDYRGAVENVFKVDFTDAKSMEEFLKIDLDVDILINCAGIFPVKTIAESTVEDYQQCFDVNVKAPFLLSKKFAEGMKNRKWGRIVNIGSSSSYAGSPNSGLYCASKHALLGLSRSQYLELKYHNIRVFCLSPGSIQTEMGKKVPHQDYSTFMNPDEIAEYLVNMIKFDNEMISEEVRLNRIIIR